ncbi:MAG: serine/threonine protein kinase [Candidatus Riflebacteria bacterium]|nr:serine/threonine protein kinase [Candidatus Riflebacteria bacterium]
MENTPPWPRGAPTAGCCLGDYVLLERLGKGGSGVVHRARQGSLHREVAIKLLLSADPLEPEGRRRFVQEGRLAARLSHPRIVHVFDVGEHEGLPYLVFELIDGGTLRDRLDAVGRLQVDEAVRTVAACAEGLGAIHAAGILHRDVKPGNIFLSRTRGPLIGDLGLGKDLSASSPMTRAGHVVGTLGYLAPETVAGAGYSASTDLYSLGLVLFEGLTGEPAFHDSDQQRLIFMRLGSEPPDPCTRRNELPPALGRFVKKALARKPQDRFLDAPHFREELLRLQGPLGDASTSVAIPLESSPAAAQTVVEKAPCARHAHRGGSRQPEAGSGARPARVLSLLGVAALACAAVAGLFSALRSSTANLEKPPSLASSVRGSLTSTGAAAGRPETDPLRPEAEALVQQALAAVGRSRRRVREMTADSPALSGSPSKPVRVLAAAWAESLPGLLAAVKANLELAGQGNPTGCTRAGACLVDQYRLYELCLDRLHEATYRQVSPRFETDLLGLQAFALVGAAMDGFRQQASGPAFRLLEVVPKDAGRGPELQLDAGVVGLLVMSRDARQSRLTRQEVSQRASKLARRAWPILLARHPPDLAGVNAGWALLTGLRWLGATSVVRELCREAERSAVRAASGDNPSGDLAAQVLAFDVEYCRIDAQLAPSDIATGPDHRERGQRAWVSLRDRFLSKWPWELRAGKAIPVPGGPAGARLTELHEAALERLTQLRKRLHDLEEQLGNRVPPEPTRPQPATGTH